MVDFIRIGLLQLWGRTLNTKCKLLSTVGFEPGIFRLRSERATSELRGLMSLEWFIVCRCLSFRNLSVARVRWSKNYLSWIKFCKLLPISKLLKWSNSKLYKYYTTQKKFRITYFICIGGGGGGGEVSIFLMSQFSKIFRFLVWVWLCKMWYIR